MRREVVVVLAVVAAVVAGCAKVEYRSVPLERYDLRIYEIPAPTSLSHVFRLVFDKEPAEAVTRGWQEAGCRRLDYDPLAIVCESAIGVAAPDVVIVAALVAEGGALQDVKWGVSRNR